MNYYHRSMTGATCFQNRVAITDRHSLRLDAEDRLNELAPTKFANRDIALLNACYSFAIRL